VSISGTVRSENTNNVGSVGAEVRAGMGLTLTDPNIPLTAYVARMQQIEKRFLDNGDEDWTITYGVVASGSQYIRRLTRAVISQ
jgi:hypothetical protein